MPVILTDREKERIRYHLGYLNTTTAASIQLGFPRSSQTLFQIETAMNLLMPEAVDHVRETLQRLDTTEAQIFEAQERLAAKTVGEITLNPDEIAALRNAYRYWANVLADIFGSEINKHASKFGGGINVRVTPG